MTNIVQFPGYNPDEEPDFPQTEEHAKVRIKTFKMNFIDELIEFEMQRIVQNLWLNGIPANNEHYLPRIIMIGELLKSVIYDHVDAEHEHRHIIEDNFNDFLESKSYEIFKAINEIEFPNEEYEED